MFTPKTSYAKIAFETILFVLKTGNYRRMEEDRIPADLKLQAACFVTAENTNEKRVLKSGGIYPQKKTLYDEMLLHAQNLAQSDGSNEAFVEDELPYLKVQVHVVSNVEEIADYALIKPGKRGVWLEQNNQVAYLLPENTKNFKEGSKVVENLLKKNDFDKSKPCKVFTFRVATYE